MSVERLRLALSGRASPRPTLRQGPGGAAWAKDRDVPDVLRTIPRRALEAVWYARIPSHRAARSPRFGLRYVYFWTDGVCFSSRMDGDGQCVLVKLSAQCAHGQQWENSAWIEPSRREIRAVKFVDGELLQDLKRRRMETAHTQLLTIAQAATAALGHKEDAYGERLRRDQGSSSCSCPQDRQLLNL